MTAYKFTSQKHLRDALNSVEKVQKANIDEYSWGHLNEKNLYKPPMSVTQSGQGGRIWRSSKKRKTVVKDAGLTPGLQTYRQKQQKDNQAEMKDVLYEFSLGIMGSVPVPPPNKTPIRQEKLNTFRKEASNISGMSEDSRKIRIDSGKSLYSQLDDGVHVEELRNNELMVQSSGMPPSYFFPKRPKPGDTDYDIMAELTQTLDMEGYLTLKHSFLPSFTSGVTKSDQFNKLRQFEDTVLRKQDCREMKVLSGVKAVAHLERRLEEVGIVI